jgi:hypothetical protein
MKAALRGVTVRYVAFSGETARVLGVGERQIADSPQLDPSGVRPEGQPRCDRSPLLYDG